MGRRCVAPAGGGRPNAVWSLERGYALQHASLQSSPRSRFQPPGVAGRSVATGERDDYVRVEAFVTFIACVTGAGRMPDL
jgi:hypothetical protein